jgi:hypothetical protein
MITDHDISALKKAADQRQLAVNTLQKKYAASHNIPTEQLALDMCEVLATERVVLDAIITLFVDVGQDDERTSDPSTPNDRASENEGR